MSCARSATCSALLAVGLAIACGGAPDPTRPMRIVLISLDALRHDRFTEEKMPAARAFAARGLVFERFYASSSATQPTHASLFTGLHPWQHGVVRNGTVLGDQHATLAERLRERGFDTAAVVASFPLDARFGFAQGFDRYDATFERVLAHGLDNWQGFDVEGSRFFRLADDVTEIALRMLDESRSARHFLFVHYFDPHDPYGDHGPRPLPISRLWSLSKEPSPKLTAVLERATRLYDRDVRALDVSLGRLLARLEADAERIETHVILTADHGESFGEDGSLSHGTRLSAQQVHVPFVLVSPAVSPGSRLDAAGSADVPATVFALAGLGAWPEGGRNLVPPADAGAAYGMRNAGAGQDRRTDGRRIPIREPHFFAVVDGTLFAGVPGAIRVGDLDEQPAGEEVERRLAPVFEGFAREFEGAETVEQVDEETREALEALGYGR